MSFFTDIVHEFPDSSLLDKLKIFHLIKFSHDTGNINDKEL